MSNIDWSVIDDKTPKFTLEGKILEGKVVSVYDGDTVNIVLPLNSDSKDVSDMKLCKFSCRLSGIDTPELRTRNEEEKKFGYEVRDKLREKVLNKVVSVQCEEFDKYGRLLVIILITENNLILNVNNWLIENGYAKIYDGGTKSKWFED